MFSHKSSGFTLLFEQRSPLQVGLIIFFGVSSCRLKYVFRVLEISRVFRVSFQRLLSSCCRQDRLSLVTVQTWAHRGV